VLQASPSTTSNAATADTGPVVRLTGISRTYFKPDGSILVEALRATDLDIERGEYMAIMGASGSGKSTLMNVLGLLDRPTSGAYFLRGSNVASLPDDEISRLRGRTIGFVFQAFNLISELSTVENVAVPLFYQGISAGERRRLAVAALQRVGLGDRLDHRPRELSGGQQQRVAIARALVTEPAILMADEPTGNLDSATGESILDLIDELHARGLTIIMVTHDERVAGRCRRIVRLRDGRIDQDVRVAPRARVHGQGNGAAPQEAADHADRRH